MLWFRCDLGEQVGEDRRGRGHVEGHRVRRRARDAAGVDRDRVDGVRAGAQRNVRRHVQCHAAAVGLLGREHRVVGDVAELDVMAGDGGRRVEVHVAGINGAAVTHARDVRDLIDMDHDVGTAFGRVVVVDREHGGIARLLDDRGARSDGAGADGHRRVGDAHDVQRHRHHSVRTAVCHGRRRVVDVRAVGGRADRDGRLRAGGGGEGTQQRAGQRERPTRDTHKGSLPGWRGWRTSAAHRTAPRPTPSAAITAGPMLWTNIRPIRSSALPF